MPVYGTGMAPSKKLRLICHGHLCRTGMKAGIPFPRGSIEESAIVLSEQRPVDRVAQRPEHRSEGPSEGFQDPSVARNKRKTIRVLRALSVALRERICEL